MTIHVAAAGRSRTRLHPLAGAVMVMLVSASTVANSAPVADADLSRRVDALIRRMTLDEKIGQLTQIGADRPGPNKETAHELIRNGRAGSVLWTINSEDIRKMQEIAVKESRLGIPLLFGFDVIHGYKNYFPVPIGLASSWDPALVERTAAIAAKEASVSGVNWTFAPMLDIARDARWGRVVEGAGEDTFLGVAMARAQVRGFQGPALGTPDRVLATAKHFAAYGAADGGRDYDSAYVPEVLLHNVYFPPFRAAVEAGVGTVMAAYMTLNDVPASGSRWLITDVLRKDMGFKGFVISDAWSVASLEGHRFARDSAEAAERGIKAGVNMDMGSNTYLTRLPRLVKLGKVPMSVIDQAVREVLAIKVRMGLFERPYADLSRKEAVFNDPSHRAATREAAQRSIVLLRNEGALLPLKPSLQRIAVIGPIADSTEEIKGPWTAEAGAAVSVLEGVRARWPQATVEFVRGGDMQRAYALPWDAREGKPAPTLMPEAEMRAEEAKAVEAARRAEVVVLVLGERAGMAGEAASSAALTLQGNQQALLEAVVATGRPVVLLLLNGRPLNITWAASKVASIVEAWFPGTEGGHAIADVLSGAVSPSGKLPVTWPRSAGHSPHYYNHNTTHAPEDEKVFTSRYADVSSLPLYPFGHGLSYTSFQYGPLELDSKSISTQGKLRVSVDVENTGAVAGDEVVQLYIHQRSGSATRPVRELKGFKRISLKPGARERVSFTLDHDELQFWSAAKRGWVLEPTDFDVWVGGDSRASQHANFTVTR
jgi:beta-glucosidase